ncbi:2-3-dimethylmalate lyase [Nymphaea thermarum]|nr:2-3-dimethylmalate lyase [Nymphaea thermarum]
MPVFPYTTLDPAISLLPNTQVALSPVRSLVPSLPTSILRSGQPVFAPLCPQRLLFTPLIESAASCPSSSRRSYPAKSWVNAVGTGTESSTPSAKVSPVEALRRLLSSPGVHQGPACFDALSAKLVEKAGFDYCFMSVSAARLALPDVGLISYGEMVDQGFQITNAVSIPIIGDGDNGYGNHMSVKRTVKGFIKAGFAGIILEDQVSPKACGHTQGRKVVSREEAVMRIKAAVDARNESGLDIVIVARTDSRQAISLEESLWRAKAFGDAGADVLFIDALASKEEMISFCEVYPLLPKMANMLEGGGKTPIFTPVELDEIGFKLVSYPLSLIGVSMRAMQEALGAIKSGRLPPPSCLPTFEEIKDTLGFNAYYEEERQYSTNDSQYSEKGSQPRIDSLSQLNLQEGGAEAFQEAIVEVVTPEVYIDSEGDNTGGKFSGIWSRSLRIKIIGRDGLEKLDVRIPAGFLDGIANIIPGLGGVNLKAMLDKAVETTNGDLERGVKLLDFIDQMGDRIQVLLE